MRKLWAAAYIAAAMCAAVASAGDDFRKGGANDLEWATGGTGAVETAVSSNEKTITKIDATHLKLRSVAKSVESAVTDNVAITGGTISGVTYTLPDNSILPVKLYRVSGTPSATTYYRGDNTWASPAGSGDMAKAVYDVGDDGQVDNAAVADTAVALSADPADCSAGQYASGISANGTLVCSAPAGTGDMLASVYDADSDNVVDSAIATSIQDNLIVDADVQTGAAINAAKIGGGGVSTAEYDFLGTVTSNVQDQLDNKSASDHAHAATYHPLENQRLGTTDNVIHKTVTADEFISSALDNTRGVTVPNTADPTTTDLAAGKMWVTDNCVRVRNNDNTVTFSAGCQIESFPFGIDNVVAEDDILLWKVPQAISIVSVTCAGSTADDIIGVLQECTAADQTSCSDLDSTDWTITNAAGGNTVLAAALEDAAIAAGAWLKWNTESVETTNSSKLSCTVQYTR